MVMYGCLPPCASPIFNVIAKKLVDYECHDSKIEKENNRIYKIFALQFVNRFCMLFYVTFYLQDMERLQKTLKTLLVQGQIVELILEVAPVLLPRVSWLWKKEQKKDSRKIELPRVEPHTHVYDLQQGYVLLLVQFG